jgi:glycerol uptake facilitator-like aquaporin
METYKYFMEFMGTTVLIYALLVSDGNPIIMALAYFGIYTIHRTSTGHFSPIGATAYYMIGRTNMKDLLMNISVQLFALNCAVIFFKPLKTLMQEFF